MRPPSINNTIPIHKDDGKQQLIMKSLYNCLIEYREPKTHRVLISLFMYLPSREEFPDYFNVIEKPIAMNKIREKIDRQLYPDEDSCMEDFKLMFSNCKFFNEDDSKIYQDAVTLESILKKRREQLHLEYNNRPSRDSKDATKEAILNTSSNEIKTTTSMTTTTTTTTNTNTTITSPSTNAKLADSNNKQLTNSTPNHPTNGNHGTTENSKIKLNHNHHNETSMDSTSNLSAELIASTPIEKCSLNTRRGRNPEAPKRQLLTGYIIYASEIRKQVIDKNPNQNFGDISRLVGNEWKALPYDIRSKYDQRALIHNKRVRERAQREALNNAGLNASGDSSRLSNGLHTPKMTKRKLAKLAKEQMKKHHLSLSNPQDDSTAQSPRVNQEQSSNIVSNQTPSSTYKSLHHPTQSSSSKVATVESSTQTTAIRFVEPPTKKRLVYSETFRKYIESLQVPNKAPSVEETTPELPTQMLGAGIGRHESPEAALWALRDFMLQDAVTMRRSLEPYLDLLQSNNNSK